VVSRENFEQVVPHPAGEVDDHEPDFEAMQEAKDERRRPTGDVW